MSTSTSLMIHNAKRKQSCIYFVKKLYKKRNRTNEVKESEKSTNDW